MANKKYYKLYKSVIKIINNDYDMSQMNMIYEGDSASICSLLGLNISKFYRLLKSKKIYLNRYLILSDEDVSKKELDNEYDYIIRHLKLYGNTSTIRNPKRYIDRLKKDGFYVTITKYPGRKVIDVVSGKIIKDKSDYIIELKKEKK